MEERDIEINGNVVRFVNVQKGEEGMRDQIVVNKKKNKKRR